MALAALSLFAFSSCEVSSGVGSGRNMDNMGYVGNIHISSPLHGIVGSIATAGDKCNVPGQVRTTCLKYNGLSVMAEIRCVAENEWTVTGEGSGVLFSISHLSRKGNIILEGEPHYDWEVGDYEYWYGDDASLALKIRSLGKVKYLWTQDIGWSGMRFSLELNGAFAAEFYVDGAVHDKLKVIYNEGDWLATLL